MNREIEFRVWDKKYKYMNYKVLVGMYGNWEDVKDDENYTACSMWIEPKNVDYKCEPHWSHFEPYHKDIVLMQYTGLKDKNGKKIFERDIVKNILILENNTFATNIDIVEFNQEDCSFMLGKGKRHFNKNLDLEVIGNIYENILESKGEE